jgi:hypothetical protein
MSTEVCSPTVTPYTSFVTMTKPEARAYLDRFLGEMPASLERLVRLSAATGGPSQGELNYTPKSLEPLWSWATPRFAWREGFIPPAFRGDFQPQYMPENLEPPQDLPSWFYHPSGHGFAQFSADTLWLIDGIARYLGQTAVESIPRTRWFIGANRPKGNMVANQPVLDGLAYEVSPIHTCTVLTARALTEWEVTPSLGETYDQFLSLANG